MPSSRRTALALATVTAVVTGGLGAAVASPAAAAPDRQPARTTPAPLAPAGPETVADRYIVVLRTETTYADRGPSVQGLAQRHGGLVRQRYSRVLNGFAATLPAAALAAVRSDPAVAYVQRDSIIRGGGAAPAATAATTVQPNPPSWGLDRIDQRNRPLNNSYGYDSTGAGVTAYIFDSGIRATHTDFGGRAQGVYDAVGDGNGTNDCHGHGTHVAGTVGGAAYGVAKGVALRAIRVLQCDNSGWESHLIAGMEWLVGNHPPRSVANFSLQGYGTATGTATEALIDSGVQTVFIAGNFSSDACANNPRSARGITVAATDDTDTRASFSNFGTCVDIFAPGVNITSAGIASDTAVAAGWSGTSMAAPHVTGWVARHLEKVPTATLANSKAALLAVATTGVVVNPGTGSPNRLLYADPGTGSTPVTVYSDTFETATGWTVNPNGTDTAAAAGRWERGDPEDTNHGGPKQLGTTVSGTNDLVTGRLAGANPGDYDVDAGVTSIRSPAITLPASGTLTLSLSWYFAHANNSSSADYFRVSIVHSGGTTQVLNQVGAATNRNAVWGSSSINLTGYAGQSVRILVQAADGSTASLVEAAVDDVKITKS